MKPNGCGVGATNLVAWSQDGGTVEMVAASQFHADA